MQFGNTKGQHMGELVERGASELGKTREVGHRFHLSSFPSRGAALPFGVVEEAPSIISGH